MTLKLILKRREIGEHNIKGRLTVIDDGIILFKCDTLELPWQDNEKNKSCIPVGEYFLSIYYNKHNKAIGIENILLNGDVTYIALKVNGVPSRSNILIHKGNFASITTKTDSQGCILVGDGYGDINKDGITDILNSSKTLKKLLDILIPVYEAGNKLKLQIIY